MTVQATIPYQSYIANGEDIDFYFNFYVENIENLVVKINGEVVGHGSYIYLEEENAIQFLEPPEANQVIELFRHTALEREIDYDTYTNRLRPETLNKDLDKIWLNLQEQALKVDQYDYDYTYSISTANQALKEVKDAQTRADSAYELADITNIETRPIERGGTGATSSEDARTNLNVHSKEEVVSLIQSGGTGTVVAVSGGGTGADNSTDARSNLDVLSATESRELMFPLGIPLWHNGVEATIPVGHLPYNGQIVNRADHPAFWDKVQNTFSIITEAEWLADPSQRGCYSLGDGSTTFRIPDLNGVQTGSIKAPVLRGHGGGVVAGEGKTVGQIDTDAIRDIQGEAVNLKGQGATASGVFSLNMYGSAAYANSGTSGVTLKFKASNVVPTAPENRMNSVYGIWICRAGDTLTEVADPTKHAVLIGANTFNGSQKVVGNVEVLGQLKVGDSSLTEHLESVTLGLNQKYVKVTVVAGTTYKNTEQSGVIFYVGVSGGGQWSSMTIDDVTLPSASMSSEWTHSITTTYFVPPNAEYSFNGRVVDVWRLM